MAGALIAVEPASVSSWQALSGFSLALGRNVLWAGLDDEAGRLAAAPLVKHLSPVLIAEAGQPMTAARRVELALLVEQAQQAAAGEAALYSAKAMEAMRAALNEGRLGSEDLSGLEVQLRGLSIYGGEAEKDYRELRVLADEQKRFDVARSMAAVAKGLGAGNKDDSVAGQTSSASSGLAKTSPGQAAGKVSTFVPAAPKTPLGSKRQGWAKATRWAGYALIGVSALFLFHLVPPLMPALGGMLAYGGFALSLVSKFLQTPVGAPQGPPAAEKPPITTGWLKDFRNLYQRAQEKIVLHERFEKEVGGGSWSAFATWIKSAFRTAFYWLPLALGSMLAGSIVAKVAGWIVPMAHAAGAAAGAAAADSGAGLDLSMSFFLNGFVAQSLVGEVLLLGVVFKGLRFLAGRIPGIKDHAGLIAGVLSLAALVPFLLSTLPLSLLLPVLGIEAVMIWAYARSGSMILPLVMRGLFTFASVDAARMMVWFTMPAGALAGIPAFWAGASVAGVMLGIFAVLSAYRYWGQYRWGFLRAGFSAEFKRLKDVGRAWSEPSVDGKPRSILPLISLGLMWGLVTYVVGDMTYWGAHLLDATSEPAPEILKRMLSMPLDIVLYNFVIVAALEEWVFRKGLFKPMVERVKKWGWPSKAWFWPAAIASSIIFSLAHFIDWSALLAHIGIGGGEVAAGITGGAYAWSWGGFLARVTAGMVMAFAYARSGILLVAMVAHFTSNSLESVGMRWGLIPYLAVAAAIMLLQAFRSRAAKP